ncbi:MAG: hypothetical protein GY841_14935 [FCB group bacterium]|nr:hypothetical protein [FCB group bacterium]
MSMKKEHIFAIQAVILILAAAIMVSFGCSDPGRYDETTTSIAGRVVVYESVTVPPMDDPKDDIWDKPLIGAITVGEDADYSDLLGQKTVAVQAIIAENRLYLRAEWNDNTHNIRPNYIIHSRDTLRDSLEVDTAVIANWARTTIPYFTAVVTDTVLCDSLPDTTDCTSGEMVIVIDTIEVASSDSLGQDHFSIMWDVGDNGDYLSGGEASDCRTMCHRVGNYSPLGHRMYTTGGGHVDVWNWQSGITDPVLLASDEYWSSQGREVDFHTQLIADTNWNSLDEVPVYSHQTDSAFDGSTLFADEAVTFDEAIDYPDNYIMPGYVLHKEVLGPGASIADVEAFSTWNWSNYIGRWQVVLSRALSTGESDDIDFSTIASGDSVLVTISVANDGNRFHSGSKPFYIVFP